MIKFGTILKPVGLQGEVRVFSDSDFTKERLVKGQRFLVDGQTLTVSKSSSSGNVHKVKFKEINSIEQAEKFRQRDLMIEELDDSLLKEDEYFFTDLIGTQVFENNQHVGEVIDVIEASAHPLLKIKTEHEEFYLPFVKAFVLEVNLNERRVEVNLIEGLR